MYKYLLFRLFTHLGSKLFLSRYPTESRVSHIVSLSRYLKFRDAFIASRATFPRRCLASAVSSAFETCLAPRIRADCLGSTNSKASLIAFSAPIFHKASPLTGTAPGTWNLYQSEPFRLSDGREIFYENVSLRYERKEKNREKSSSSSEISDKRYREPRGFSFLRFFRAPDARIPTKSKREREMEYSELANVFWRWP